MDRYIMVALGGGLGSLARYIVGIRFPAGTIIVNVTGSFLAGFLTAFLSEHFDASPNFRLLLIVGFLGGYTTFSAFELETYEAIRNGGYGVAALNVVVSVAIGLAGVWLGASLGRR